MWIATSRRCAKRNEGKRKLLIYNERHPSLSRSRGLCVPFGTKGSEVRILSFQNSPCHSSTHKPLTQGLFAVWRGPVAVWWQILAPCSTNQGNVAEVSSFASNMSCTISACRASRLRLMASLSSRLAIQRLNSTKVPGSIVFIVAIFPVAEMTA
jgi:hypothetical protein